MGRIFISYRRSDSVDVTGRIYDHLKARFGNERVFRDFDSIPVGSDFRKSIARALQSCDVLVTVIGPDWLNCRDAHGQRRLDVENDLVRLELETAIKLKLPVIPVLVGNSQMPNTRELPPSLRPLSYRNATKVRSDYDFSADIERLSKAIEDLVAGAKAELPASDRSSNETLVQPSKRMRPLTRVMVFTAALVLFATLTELVFEGVRSSQFARHAELLIDSSATEQQLLDAKNWFSDYSTAYNGFVFAPKSDEARGYLAKFDSQLDILRDRNLYERVLERPDIDACEAYVKSSPLKTMLPEVSNYLEYLRTLGEQKEIGVSIQLTWADKSEPRAAHALKLTINGSEIAVVPEGLDVEANSEKNLFESEPGALSTLGHCKLPMADNVAISVNLTQVKKGLLDRATFWSQNAFVGNADKVTKFDLIKGLEIELHPQKDDGHRGNQIRIIIKDPPPPDLPPVHP